MNYNKAKKYLKNNPKTGYEIKFNGSKMCEGDLPVMFKAISQLMVLHVSSNPSIDEHSTNDDLFKVLLRPLKTIFASREYTNKEYRDFYNAYFELANNSPKSLISLISKKGIIISPNI